MGKKRGPPGERPLRWVWGNLKTVDCGGLLRCFLADLELDAAAHEEHIEIVEFDRDVLELAGW
jgi:hypothetical protein